MKPFLFLCAFIFGFFAMSASPPDGQYDTQKIELNAIYALQIEAPAVDAVVIEGNQFSNSRLSVVVAPANVFALVAPTQTPALQHGNNYRLCGSGEANVKTIHLNTVPSGLQTSKADFKVGWQVSNVK